MKNKKVLKMMLAFALAGAVFTPSIEKSFAADDLLIDKSVEDYLKVHMGLSVAINRAKEVKKDYRYLNASSYYKKNLDQRVADAELIFKQAPTYSQDSSVLEKIKNATSYLDSAIAVLDGKVADSVKLRELIEDDLKFYYSDAYNNASYLQKSAYVTALTEARVYVNQGVYALSQATVDKLQANLTKIRKEINDSYLEIKARVDLKDEIKKSTSLKNDEKKYTKESFATFLSALKLAEASLEDDFKDKTAEKYKYLKENLRIAREGLVKVKQTNPSLEKQIKRLEDAINRSNKTRAAAQLLINRYPETIKNIKKELEVLVAKSEKDVDEAYKVLEKLKKMRG